MCCIKKNLERTEELGNFQRTSQLYTYILASRSRNRMKFVITLITNSLEPFCFNNTFMHNNENRCICNHRK